MLLAPRITFQDVPHSTAIEANILNKIQKLDRFYDRIMHCDVVIEQMTKHHHKGKLYKTHISLTVPGEEIVINRASNQDLYVSTRDAFNAAVRKLQDFARRRRGDNKSHTMTMHGTITRIFKQEGYGFIESNSNEYYFSFSNVANTDFEELTPNTEVQFILVSADEGLQANRVSVGKHHIF